MLNGIFYNKYCLILRMIFSQKLILFFYFSLVLFSCSKDNTPSCISDGKINEVCTVQYIINGKNNKTDFYHYQNNQLSLIESEDKNKEILTTSFEYQNNNLIKKVSENLKGITQFIEEYEYKNNELSKVIHNKDSIIEYFYENGQKTKIKFYKNNILVFWDSILYYPNQKIYQQKKYTPQDILVKIEEFKWFVNNTFTQETILPNGTINRKISSLTNNQNQIIEQKIYNQDLKLIQANYKKYNDSLLIYESFNDKINGDLLEIKYHRIQAN